jgi:predicted membrane protein
MTEWDKDSTGDSIRGSIHESVHRDIHNRINASVAERVGARADRTWGHQGGYHGIIWGGAVCLIGVLLLLDHLGYVSADHFWRFWPMLLIVAGAINLTQTGKRIWGGLLLVAGILFQLDGLGVLRFHWADLWPLVVIAAGAMMIWRSVEARRDRDAYGGPAATLGGMNATAVFGGVERRVSSRDFKRGSISAVFGGAEIDFHDADIDGPEGMLEVNAIFGGAEIRVPDTWRVEFRGQTLFGGYSDTTRQTVSGDPNASSVRKTLIITGTTLFGGVEVKN